MNQKTEPTGNPATWRVIRNQDHRDILRYGFDTRAEAEAAARDLADPKHPFTYSVRQDEN